MNRCLCRFLDCRLIGQFAIHSPLGDLFFRPQAPERISVRVNVPVGYEEVRVFAAPPIEDGERLSCNLRDTSPRFATAALTAF